MFESRSGLNPKSELLTIMPSNNNNSNNNNSNNKNNNKD